MINRKLGASFDRISELYDRVRGNYPKQLIVDILKASDLTETSRVLDIGCGTGKSILPFANIGCRITAIDFSEDMIAVAKRNLSGYHNVEYVVSAFETVQLDNESFDLVISGTAFHWLDPKVAYRKAGSIIKKDGCLAIFWGFSDHTKSEFLQKARKIFMRNSPDYLKDFDKFEVEAIANIKKTRLFEKPRLLKYEIVENKTPKQWLERVASNSWFISSPESVKKRIVAELKDLIKKRNEIAIRFPRAYRLVLANKSRH